MQVSATAATADSQSCSKHRPNLPGLSDCTATRLALVLLAIGLTWRTVRYLLQFPVWGDEAMLATNLAWFDYGQLTQRLENCQIAPLMFLWGERTAYTWFGPSEYSLRLLPFLASVFALGVYWRLTGLLLNPQARLFAVGFLAVANFSVVTSNSLKPYSLDLLAALALLEPAVQWLKAPDKRRWLVLLTLFAPVALVTSYPAAFVAGGISVALCRRAWQAGRATRCWFAAYHVTVLAGFVIAYAVGANQLNTTTGGASTQLGMTTYWAHGFPPASLWDWPWWFVRLTTGQMMAYPLGDANGGSILTVVCVAMGAVILWRRRDRECLALFGVPLLLNLVAAAMHRYPYGGSARLSQHLAPGICVLAGLGLAAAIARARPALGTKWSYAAVGLFACIGVGGLVRDVRCPYYSPGADWMRTTVKEMRSQVHEGDPVIVCGDSGDFEIVLVWYWLNEGTRVTWNYELPQSLAAGQVWGYHQGAGADLACQRLEDELARQDPAWRLVKRTPYVYEPKRRKEAPQRCELFHFVKDRRQRSQADRLDDVVTYSSQRTGSSVP